MPVDNVEIQTKNTHQTRGFQAALNAWKTATEQGKRSAAEVVMMHAGGMGKKLADLVDADTAAAIIADAKRPA